MMKLKVAIVIMLGASSVHAESLKMDHGLSLHGWSHHAQKVSQYSQQYGFPKWNPGVGYFKVMALGCNGCEYDQEWGIMYNSYRRWSLYTSHGMAFKTDFGKIGGSMIAATSYGRMDKKTPGNIAMMPAMTFEPQWNTSSLLIRWIPDLGPNSATWAVSYRIRF